MGQEIAGEDAEHRPQNNAMVFSTLSVAEVFGMNAALHLMTREKLIDVACRLSASHERLRAESIRLRDAIKFIQDFDDLDDLVRDVAAKALESKR
jgi:hypothetical protein